MYRVWKSQRNSPEQTAVSAIPYGQRVDRWLTQAIFIHCPQLFVPHSGVCLTGQPGPSQLTSALPYSGVTYNSVLFSLARSLTFFVTSFKWYQKFKLENGLLPVTWNCLSCKLSLQKKKFHLFAYKITMSALTDMEQLWMSVVIWALARMSRAHWKKVIWYCCR